MRAFLLVFTCLLVVGIVLFAMMQAPAPKKTEIEVVRIDSVERTQPILQNDTAAGPILESFPEPEQIQEAVPSGDEENTVISPPVSPNITNRKPSSENSDNLNRLLALIDDWIYVDFAQIGIDNKTGTIRKTRENEFLSVFEGKELENGIKVDTLTDDACTLALGGETFTLRRVEEPSFFQEVKQKMRPLSVEEQEMAYKYYMRRYGDKFKAYSAMYKPPYGTQNPKRVTPDDKRKGLQDYFERYGKQFQQEGQQNTAPFPYSEQQKENYIKYWQTFFPDRPMPAFEEMFNKDNQIQAGSRVSPDQQSQ